MPVRHSEKMLGMICYLVSLYCGVKDEDGSFRQFCLPWEDHSEEHRIMIEDETVAQLGNTFMSQSLV